jgi:putative DNA primase/helicase
VNASNLANIPAVLQSMPNWVAWKLVERNGEPTKPPFIVGTNRHASSTDPSTWTTYETAVASLAATGIGKESGIGFAIGGAALDMNLIAIDIDGCLFPDGTATPWADELMAVAAGYTEITPSETGLRIIGTGKLPSDGKVFRIDPAAGYGDKVQIECYDCKKYITMTGDIFYEDAGDIEPLNMSAIYAVIRGIQKKHPILSTTEKKTTSSSSEGKGTRPRIQRTVTATAFTTEYELFTKGELSGDGPWIIADEFGNSLEYSDYSCMDADLCYWSALKHGDDRDAIWNDYADSAISRPKWLNREADFCKGTIAKAITWAQEFRKRTSKVSTSTDATNTPTVSGVGNGITFTRPRVERDESNSHLDYVIAAGLGKWDGWFPLGDISLVGGPSGSGKSTLIYELLDKQRRCETVFGHETNGLPFLIVTYDRGKNAHKRTMKRLGLEGREKDFPTEHLSPFSQDSDVIAQELINAIEKHETLPKVLFVEGGDIASADPSKSGPTRQFLSNLTKIANHFHFAIILSVGTPKMKADEGYVAQRDHVFGSTFWGRMAETIAVMHLVEGDDTSPRRKLAVLLRNEVAEKFSLMFNDEGRLVPDDGYHDETEEPEFAWFRAQTNWFTYKDVMKGLDVSRPEAVRLCQYGVEDGYLQRKPGPRMGRGTGIKSFKYVSAARVPLDEQQAKQNEQVTEAITIDL